MKDLVLGHQDGKQQRRRKPKSSAFSPAKRQKFLDALALTCNARMAAAHAGVDATTPYYHRSRDPQFVEQWRAAIATGYDRLEALVLVHGGAGESLEPADPERAEAEGAEVPPFDFERALKILQQFRRKRDGEPVNPGGRPRRNATREETNAVLMKALAAAHKRLSKSQADG